MRSAPLSRALPRRFSSSGRPRTVLAQFACALALVWDAALSARAADRLEIPPSCGSAQELEQEVGALRASGASAASARPEVHISQEADHFVLEIALPDGPRTLRDADCRALFRAAIVIAALGRDPAQEPASTADGDETQLPPATPPAPATTPNAPAHALLTKPVPNTAATASPARAPGSRSEPPEAPPPVGRERATGPSRAELYAQAELAYGAVPSFSAALALGVAYRRGRWGVRGEAGYVTPRVARDVAGDVRVQGMSAALLAEVAALERLRVDLGTQLFFLRGRGLSVSGARADWTAQPALALGVRVPVAERGAFGFSFTARGLWSPQPSSFELRQGERLYRASQLAFSLGVAGSFQFL